MRGDLLRPGGWTMAHETETSLAAAVATAETAWRDFGVEYRALDAAALAQEEPHLRPASLAACNGRSRSR